MTRNALLAVAALAALASSPLAANAQAADPSARILVQNKYYPKPGQEEVVLATRLEASAVRARLGLPTGIVLLRKNEVDGAPVVVWECEYPSIEARRADAAAAEAAPEFKAVQAKMRGITVKFERVAWELRPAS